MTSLAKMMFVIDLSLILSKAVPATTPNFIMDQVAATLQKLTAAYIYNK